MCYKIIFNSRTVQCTPTNIYNTFKEKSLYTKLYIYVTYINILIIILLYNILYKSITAINVYSMYIFDDIK